MRSCAQHTSFHQLWTRCISIPQRLQPRLLASHQRTIKTIATVAATPILCYCHPINTSTSAPSSKTGYHLIHRNIMSTEHEAKKTDPHTIFPKPFVYGKVEIHPVALFGDNYSYVILDTSDNSAILVDPADPYTILHELRTRFHQYTVTHILTTHKHWDHAGGNQKIKEHLHEIQVVGGVNDGIPAVTMPVKHGDSLKLSGSINVSVIEAPCHTSGHVLYYVNQKFLFTGDTLFIGGCGRFFEGDAAQMYDNFYNKIGKLPDDTDLYVGHEYTVANLEFALWIEPDNEALKQKYRWAQSQREKKHPTIPSTIGDEKQINPFMRVTQSSVISRISKLGLDASTPIQVMHHLRQLKNENAHQKK